MERKMLNKLADLLERFLESEGEEQEVMRSHIIRMGKEYAPGERDGEIKRILMDCADMKSVFSLEGKEVPQYVPLREIRKHIEVLRAAGGHFS